MADHQGLKIKELINNIESGKLILPSLQRDFVWSPDKICDLFDSIIRDYPIGTFLFWEINRRRASEKLRFRQIHFKFTQKKSRAKSWRKSFGF